MNILMTNDDGIDFEWFIWFVKAMREMGKTRGHTIYVVAPEGERSGFSHYITFIAGPIRLKKREENMWACSGTPADCVMMASMGALPFTVDLVVSGINRGANLGTDLVYSGTAAAARQASLHHIPAVAYSLAGETRPLYWEKAVAYAVEHVEEFAALWREDIFINVNLPNSPFGAAGSKITFPSRRMYKSDKIEVFDAPDHKRYCFMKSGAVETICEAGSDYDAVSLNLASITPVFIHPVAVADMCTGAPKHAGVGFRPRN
ncbi:MAG: 5'/3'-nucleotidase SurE [Treponema sp.]|jgi:5'-nucleotidase|nr:5'/3'-nucleotidase SurE [Treponema sp.]